MALPLSYGLRCCCGCLAQIAVKVRLGSEAFPARPMACFAPSPETHEPGGRIWGFCPRSPAGASFAFRNLHSTTPHLQATDHREGAQPRPRNKERSSATMFRRRGRRSPGAQRSPQQSGGECLWHSGVRVSGRPRAAGRSPTNETSSGHSDPNP